MKKLLQAGHRPQPRPGKFWGPAFCRFSDHKTFPGLKEETPQDRAALKEAQRKWLAYLDAERQLITAVCYFTPDGSPAGTIAQVESNAQFVQLVRQRVLRLENYLKILEGNGNN